MRATTALLASSPRWANGPLMARKIIQRPGANSWQIQGNCLTCAYEVERVTRIELALSAWEAERSRLLRALTCRFRWSGVAVIDPSSPWLMARRPRVAPSSPIWASPTRWQADPDRSERQRVRTGSGAAAVFKTGRSSPQHGR